MPTAVHAFLFTDIEGSTALWAQEPAAMEAALLEHDQLIEEVVTAHNGSVFKMVGDAACVAFAAPEDALRAALACQSQVEQRTWPTSVPLRIRCALHVGPAIHRSNDFFGPSLNTVARILGSTHPGQVLTSEAFKMMILSDSDVAWRDLGRHQMKGLPEPVALWQVNSVTDTRTFPPFAKDSRPPTNLPASTNSFHGRRDESRLAFASLATARLVVLIGAGGSGKTRLAQEVARGVEGYPDGVWYIKLSDITDRESLLGRIAATFNVSANPFDSLETRLIGHFSRKTCLLVIDNCEHIIREVSGLLSELLHGCPNVKVLATSRVPLGLPFEQCIQIPPLPVPQVGDKLSKSLVSPAIQLFQARASAVDATFRLQESDLPHVQLICKKLSGIPLAIELVAARVATLPLSRIAERIDDKVLTITNLDPSVEQRQQTLNDAIRWSFDLLKPTEALLLQRVAVFSGGFQLPAAELVCTDASLPEDSIEEALSGLVRSSLVSFQRDHERYVLLEPIREFAARLLRESEQESAVRDRHVGWANELAEEAEPHLQQGDAAHWLTRLDQEHENFRAALRWATEPERRLRIAASLHRYWRMRGLHHEGIGWMSGVMHHAANIDPALLAKASNSLGILLWSEGRYEEAAERLRVAMTEYERLGNHQRMAGAMANLGNVLSDQGEFAESEVMHRRAILAYQEIGDATNEIRELSNLACCLCDGGKEQEGMEIFETVRQRQSGGEDFSAMATTSGNIAMVASLSGDREKGQTMLLEAVRYAEMADDHHLWTWLLLPAACVAESLGDVATTAELMSRRDREAKLHDIAFGVFDRTLSERMRSKIAGVGDQTDQDPETPMTSQQFLQHVVLAMN